MTVALERPPSVDGEHDIIVEPRPDAQQEQANRQTGGTTRAPRADTSDAPEDLATWFAYYLAAVLLTLLGLGGLWISNFAR
jgi:hypothetical protein